MRKRYPTVVIVLASLCFGVLAPLHTNAQSMEGHSSIESFLRSALDAERKRNGLPALVRDAALKRSATMQAEAIAARPSRNRLKDKTPLNAWLAKVNLVDYADAQRHAGFISGYSNLAQAHLKSWQQNGSGWQKVLDPKTDTIELAVASTRDDGSILVAIAVDYGSVGRDPKQMEQRVHEVANRVREQHGKAPLKWNEALARVARKHSQEMAEKDFFEHQSPTTGGPADRVTKAKIGWSKVAENLWLGRVVDNPAEATIEGWLTSSGHRKNLLDAEMTEGGVGIVLRKDGTWFVTQLYRRP